MNESKYYCPKLFCNIIRWASTERITELLNMCPNLACCENPDTGIPALFVLVSGLTKDSFSLLEDFLKKGACVKTTFLEQPIIVYAINKIDDEDLLLQTVKLLVIYGANVHSKTTLTKMSALYFAKKNNKMNVYDFLVEAGEKRNI